MKYGPIMPKEPDLDSAYALKSPEDNRRLYRAWAETYDAEFVEATGFRFPYLISRTYVALGGGWPCLDIGCGTGAVAKALPKDAIIDGIDLSPEMLNVARRTGCYREVFEADLMQPLSFEAGIYAGLVSSGTFTHGHVDASPLPALVDALISGGVAVLSIKPEIWESHGFSETFESLVGDGLISKPELNEELVYASPDVAPTGHAADTGFIVSFKRL